MSYRRVVLASWSRRDWLAIAIVAATATFIAGATLMLLATSAAIYDQTAAFDSDTTVRYVDGPVDDGGIVLPVATVETGDGTPAVVVGIPSDVPRVVPGASLLWNDAELPSTPPSGQVFGPVPGSESVTLRGSDGTATRDVVDGATRRIVPQTWYVADVETVEQLGRTGSLVFEPHPGERSPPAAGVVVTAAVPFLLAGARDILETLALVALAGGVLAGVAVYNLARLSIYERMQTFFVVRATGGGPIRLWGLVTLRGFLLAAVGVGLGALVGIGTVKAIAAVAAAAGFPTSVDPTLTPTTSLVLAAMLGQLLVVGTLAGLLAGLEAVTGPPGRLPLEDEGRPPEPASRPRLALRARLTPRWLGWRALAPTTASLSVFVIVLLVATSVGAAFAPLTAGAGGSVTDPEAPHLLASRVDADAAGQLRAEGVDASPEIIVTQVRDGQPYLVRGVDYDAFARVTDAGLVDGRAPVAGDEAVIGADLARTLDVSVGDTITLGGASAAAVARVRVVGSYRAPGLLDDQLLVSLAVARHLGRVGPDQVMLVRTSGEVPESLAASSDTESGSVGRTTVSIVDPDADTQTDAQDAADERGAVVVSGIDAPAYAPEHSPVEVRLTLRNVGGDPAEHEVAVASGGTERVQLAPETERTVTVALPVGSPGTYRLAVGGMVQPLVVLPADGLRVEPAFDRVPPNATVTLSVFQPDGSAAANAAVAFQPADGSVAPASAVSRSVTDAAGTVELRTPAEPGEYVLVAETDARSSGPVSVTVAADAPRPLVADLEVEPAAVPAGRAPTASVTLANPWAAAVTREVRIEWAGGTETRPVTVDPGGTASVEARLGAVAEPGEYAVNVTAGGRMVAQGGFAVVDAATVLAGGVSPGSAIGGELEGVFGNLELLQFTLILLSAGMVLGSTATAFAQAVYARRRTIGVLRATGASPGRMLRLVLTDAARLGGVATVLALPLAVGAVLLLEHLGYLTVFGIRFAAVPSPALLATSAASALALALTAAALATWGLLRERPASLLSGRTGRVSWFAERLPAGDGWPASERTPALLWDGGETDD